MNEREQLEQQLRELDEQKVALYDGGNPDPAEVERLNQQIKGIQQQLNALDTKQAIIADASNPESSFTLTVDGYTVDFRTEAASEESYQALSIVTQLKLQELEESNQAEIKALRNSWEIERKQFEMQIESLVEAKTSAQQSEENYKQANQILAEQLHDANLQTSDLVRKLSIAASEIESLKAQNEELSNQVSKPSVPTNLNTGNIAEVMQKLKASKRAIYNVQKDAADINYTANYADTGEEFTDKVIYIGKYRELSEEEAARFRAELEAAKEAEQAELESIPEADSAIEPIVAPPIFRDEEDGTHNGHELAGDTVETESVPQNDGATEIEDRVKELERKVEFIQRHLFSVEAPEQSVESFKEAS